MIPSGLLLALCGRCKIIPNSHVSDDVMQAALALQLKPHQPTLFKYIWVGSSKCKQSHPPVPGLAVSIQHRIHIVIHP